MCNNTCYNNDTIRRSVVARSVDVMNTPTKGSEPFELYANDVLQDGLDSDVVAKCHLWVMGIFIAKYHFSNVSEKKYLV